MEKGRAGAHPFAVILKIPEAASGFEQNPRSTRGKMKGARNLTVAAGSRSTRFRPVLFRPPLDEILPEHDPTKGREARQVKPVPRRRIRYPGADGELFGIHRLIQPALFQHRFKRDAVQLLVFLSRVHNFSFALSVRPRARNRTDDFPKSFASGERQI